MTEDRDDQDAAPHAKAEIAKKRGKEKERLGAVICACKTKLEDSCRLLSGKE